MFKLIFKDMTGRIVFSSYYMSKPSDNAIAKLKASKQLDLKRTLTSSIEIDKFTGINKNYAKIN